MNEKIKSVHAEIWGLDPPKIPTKANQLVLDAVFHGIVRPLNRILFDRIIPEIKTGMFREKET